jgi:hypothetical protein
MEYLLHKKYYTQRINKNLFQLISIYNLYANNVGENILEAMALHSVDSTFL